MINKYKSIKYASIVGIIGNLFLAVIKLIIGLITKSKAMMAMREEEHENRNLRGRSNILGV